MDPFTFSLLLCLAIGFSAKAAGGGVAHAAAGIRGKPSPTVQEWKDNEKARRKAGLPPRQRPKSILRTAWQNAVEEWAVTSEQKHHGRIEALRELGPEVSARAKKRLLWRASLRAKLADRVANLSGASRDRLMRISGDIRSAIEQRRNQAGNGEVIDSLSETRDEGPDAQVIVFPTGRTSQDAEVVEVYGENVKFFGALPNTPCPVRPDEGHLYSQLFDGTRFCLNCELEKVAGYPAGSDDNVKYWGAQPGTPCPVRGAQGHLWMDSPSHGTRFCAACDRAKTFCPTRGEYLTEICRSCPARTEIFGSGSDQGTSPGQESSNNGGNQHMATVQEETIALPEPTNLPTAIQYADTVRDHMDRLSNKVAEDATIFANNAQALKVQVAAIETGQESLSSIGFRSGTVQDGLAKAAELAPAAAEKLRELETLAQTVGEQLQEIRDAMSSVSGALKSQQSLADEAQSHHAVGGTADRTEFYREG